MLLDREIQSKIESFKKYAQFLSDKFDVEIRLDGSKACTDGKIISIPNIAGMEQKEIDFLRCVILHELSHVKFTPFTNESRKRYKTNAHFMLCNALEDARVENATMKIYDGAHDIFSRLYNEYLMDTRFMDRVFNGSLKNSDTFHLISCYLHDVMVKLDNRFSFMRIISKQKRYTIKSFIEKNKIEKLVEEHPFKTHDDVCDLADKIYAILCKTTKDESSKNDIDSLRNKIDEALQNDIPEMTKKAKELQKVLDKMVADIQKEQKELEAMEDTYGKFRKTIKPELDQIRKEQQKLVDAIKAMKNRDAKNKKIRSAKIALAKKQGKIANEQNKQDEMTRQLQDFEEGSKEAEKLKEKMRKSAERRDKHYPSVRKLNEKIIKYQNELEKAEKALEKLSPDMMGQSRNDLIRQYKDNIARKDHLRQKLDEMLHDIQEQENKINNMAQDYHDAKSEAGKEIANTMKNIEDGLHKEGVPSQIMPEFDKNADWPEGDKEQSKFDKKASHESGDIVTNGSGFSQQSTRDILALIDKTKNDLESIDLVKHFDEKHSSSKLDSFNDTNSEITNTEIVESGEKVMIVHRAHVPLTTAYDKITTENTSDGRVLENIKQKNSLVLSRVKNIFRLKFKVQKRDRFRPNREEGQIDTRNLWKIASRQNDSHVFEENDPKLINKVKASILIDNSGSLDKNEDANIKLQTLALFLSEGLKEVFVQHEISTFNCPISDEMRKIDASGIYNRTVNSLETVIHKKFEDKDNKGIQNIAVKASDNSDGEALRLAVARLLKQQCRKRVLFVVSDCKPFLPDANLGILDAHLIDAVKWAKAQSVAVYSISFGNAANGKTFYEENHCNINSWDDLTKFLSAKLV